jgi:hypothetical protein
MEKQETEPLLLIGTRGERAILDRLMESLQSGTTGFKRASALLGYDLGILLGGSLKGQRAPLLQFMTEYVEAAKLPEEQQVAEIKKIENSVTNWPSAVRMLAPTMVRVVPASVRHKAQLRCAIVALAVERYRLQHGRWPDSLADLSPDLIAKIPMDPYLGKPLRYRRLADGVVIYSVGPDGRDDGGKIDRKNNMAPGTDIGIQLWDPDKRRQPPPPKKTEDEIDLPNEEPKSP